MADRTGLPGEISTPTNPILLRAKITSYEIRPKPKTSSESRPRTA
nr:MAG TPA_asm: hypothetical protein [Caudoviricetes sp.]